MLGLPGFVVPFVTLGKVVLLTRISFSEDVRQTVVSILEPFVGEPVTVQHFEPGHRKEGTVYSGQIVAVYHNGFLLDGEDLGKREFFSYSDLFAQHARVIDGPAALSLQRVLGRLRNDLAHAMRPDIVRSALQAVPA